MGAGGGRFERRVLVCTAGGPSACHAVAVFYDDGCGSSGLIGFPARAMVAARLVPRENGAGGSRSSSGPLPPQQVRRGLVRGRPLIKGQEVSRGRTREWYSPASWFDDGNDGMTPHWSTSDLTAA